MFALEPGPLVPFDPDAMRRLTPRPAFPSIVADALENMPGLRAALDGSALGVTDNPPDDLDGTYTTTIGSATTIVAEEIQPAPPSPIPSLVANGDGADAIRQSVVQYLPQPSAPISASFVDPPPVPAAAGGSSFDQGPGDKGDEPQV